MCSYSNTTGGSQRTNNHEIALARFCHAGKGTSRGFLAGFLAARHPKHCHCTLMDMLLFECYDFACSSCLECPAVLRGITAFQMISLGSVVLLARTVSLPCRPRVGLLLSSKFAPLRASDLPAQIRSKVVADSEEPTFVDKMSGHT